MKWFYPVCLIIMALIIIIVPSIMNKMEHNQNREYWKYEVRAICGYSEMIIWQNGYERPNNYIVRWQTPKGQKIHLGENCTRIILKELPPPWIEREK